MIEAEYGTVGNVRFPNPDSCAMHDSTGAIIKCKCGKEAGSAIMGKSAFVAYCSECDPNKKYSANFVYRPSNYPGPIAMNAKLAKEGEIYGEDKKEWHIQP